MTTKVISLMLKASAVKVMTIQLYDRTQMRLLCRLKVLVAQSDIERLDEDVVKNRLNL